MIYKMEDFPGIRKTFIPRLCSGCNHIDGVRGMGYTTLRDTGFGLVSIEKQIDLSWPYMCPSCALKRVWYDFLGKNRPSGSRNGIILPTIHAEFSVDAFTSGRFQIADGEISHPMIDDAAVFFVREQSAIIRVFATVGKQYAVCTKNTHCPGCGGSVAKKESGIIALLRARNREWYSLLCPYCSGEIVNFYRRLFQVAKDVLLVANI